MRVESSKEEKAQGLTVSSICFSPACTDKELRNLASRLKDWFGALHEDANRVVKPTSSDKAQGSKTALLSLIYLILNTTFPPQLLDVVDGPPRDAVVKRNTKLNVYTDLKYAPVSETLKYGGEGNALESRKYYNNLCFLKSACKIIMCLVQSFWKI